MAGNYIGQMAAAAEAQSTLTRVAEAVVTEQLEVKEPIPGGLTAQRGAHYSDPEMTTLHLGSGGGSAGAQSEHFGGADGDGGGAIQIDADTIIVTGQISADGADGEVEGRPNNLRGGGGGSGGSVLLRARSLDIGEDRVTALGGIGGTGIFDGRLPAGGGNGGVGRIRLDYETLVGTTNPPANTGTYVPPTPTPEPTPPPTPVPMVIVEAVSANAVDVGTSLIPGSAIVFDIAASNPTQINAETAWTWSIFDEQGQVVPALSFDDHPVTVEPGPVRLALYRVVPTTLEPGSDRFVGTVEVADEMSSRTTMFAVDLDTTGPSVSVGATTAGEAVTEGAAIDVDAVDDGGRVAQIEVRYCPDLTCTYDDGVAIGGDDRAPYSVPWFGQPNDGTYSLVTRATDRVGNTTDSALVPVEVANDPTPPETPALSLAEDEPYQHVAGSTVFHSPSGQNTGSFTVSVATTDPESGIASVELPELFGGDGASLATLPYEHIYTWDATDTASGLAPVRARNGVGRQATAEFAVQADTAGPTVSIQSPVAGAAVADELEIAINADDGDGAGVAVVGVRACQGASCDFEQGISIGETVAVPFTITWTDRPPDGAYTLIARATDQVGNSATWAPVTLDVANDPTPPTDLTISLSEDDPSALVGGGRLFYNPSAAGEFTVVIDTADPDSGIASVLFPPSSVGMS